VHQLRRLQRTSPVSLALVGRQDGDSEAMGAMDRLRSAPLELRKQMYLDGRVAAQQRWYDRNADRQRRRGNTWRGVLLALELTGVVLATLQLIGVIAISTEGLMATAIAASSAWLQTRQHETLARRYSSTALELDHRRTLGAQPVTEPDWSSYVEKTEAVILAEHGLWLATRVGNEA
jgi:hypothetical protein